MRRRRENTQQLAEFEQVTRASALDFLSERNVTDQLRCDFPACDGLSVGRRTVKVGALQPKETPTERAIRLCDDHFDDDVESNLVAALLRADVVERSHEVPVIVEVWSPGDRASRAVTEVIRRAVAKTNGRVVRARANIAAHPGIASAFQVTELPSVFAFKNGEQVDSFAGLQVVGRVRKMVAKLVDDEAAAASAVDVAMRDLADNSVSA